MLTILWHYLLLFSEDAGVLVINSQNNQTNVDNTCFGLL